MVGTRNGGHTQWWAPAVLGQGGHSGYWLPRGRFVPAAHQVGAASASQSPVPGSAPVPAGTAPANGLGGLAQGEGRLPGGVRGEGAWEMPTGMRGSAPAVVTSLQ